MINTTSTYIIPSDFPDPDIIRVDDTYYMISTTMHFMPGAVILRSYNLIDWEFCSYVYDELDTTPGQTLQDNKGIYGRGMWAASLRYYKGIFYVSFVANDTHKTYLYTSTNIQGPWKKANIKGFYHDMSILFDDDDKVYIVHGNTEITLTQMNEDLSGPKTNGTNKIIIQDDKDKITLGYEGSHFYKINGKYYIFLIHMPKGKMRSESCFVSDKIEGPYTHCTEFCSDLHNWNSGVAQGGIVQSTDGKWFGVLFQDHGALGRIPVLVPVIFIDDVPVFGEDGIAPDIVSIHNNKPNYKYAPLYTNDFTNPAWQFNHIPNKKLTSVSQNSYSITTDKTVINITQATNTLTQRTFTEHCEGTVTVDACQINEGDFTGFCALEGEYGFIAITKENEEFYLVEAEHKIPYSPWTMGVHDDSEPTIIEKKKIENSSLILKMKFDLSREKQEAQFFYFDTTSKKFEQFGKSVKLRYTLDQFVGVRFALFLYSTKHTGGKSTFSDFNYSIL